MSFLQDYHRQAVDYWSRHSPRQQIFWGGCSAILIGLLAYFLVVAPWIKRQQELDKAVPMLRADLTKMMRLAEQVHALPASGAQAVEINQLIADLKKEFSQPNASDPEVRDDGQQRLRLTIERADFDATLARLAIIQNKHRLRVVSASFFRREGAPGQVQVDIVFARPLSE